MSKDIVPFKAVNLPNIFCTGGDQNDVSPTISKILKRHIAIGLLTKFSRTSPEEFKFIIDALNIESSLEIIGEAGYQASINSTDHSGDIPKTTYLDVYNKGQKMTYVQDNLFRNIVVRSVFASDKMALMIAKSLVTVVHLIPVKPEELTVVSPSLYTITIDLKVSLIASDMEKVYRKHMPKDDD